MQCAYRKKVNSNSLKTQIESIKKRVSSNRNQLREAHLLELEYKFDLVEKFGPYAEQNSSYRTELKIQDGAKISFVYRILSQIQKGIFF